MGRTVYQLSELHATDSEELFSLAVSVIALGVAVGANMVFGVSLALGAFFAGVIVSGSGVEHRAAVDVARPQPGEGKRAGASHHDCVIMR